VHLACAINEGGHSEREDADSWFPFPRRQL
jgi:hypothetical protein